MSDAQAPQTWRAQVSVARDDPAFAGHFPGRPILPAVVVLMEVLAAIEAQTGRSPEQWTISNAKFFDAITPGDLLTLSHSAMPSGALRFEVHCVRGAVASGTLAPHLAP